MPCKTQSIITFQQSEIRLAWRISIFDDDNVDPTNDLLSVKYTETIYTDLTAANEGAHDLVKDHVAESLKNDLSSGYRGSWDRWICILEPGSQEKPAAIRVTNVTFEVTRVFLCGRLHETQENFKRVKREADSEAEREVSRQAPKKKAKRLSARRGRD